MHVCDGSSQQRESQGQILRKTNNFYRRDKIENQSCIVSPTYVYYTKCSMIEEIGRNYECGSGYRLNIRYSTVCLPIRET